VVDAVAPAARDAMLKPVQLSQRARLVQKIDAASVDQR